MPIKLSVFEAAGDRLVPEFYRLMRAYTLRSLPCPITHDELIEASVDPDDLDILKRAAAIADDFESGCYRLRGTFELDGGTENYSFTTNDPVDFFQPGHCTWDRSHPATGRLVAYVQRRAENALRMHEATRAFTQLLKLCQTGGDVIHRLPSAALVFNRVNIMPAKKTKLGASVPVELGAKLRDVHQLLGACSLIDWTAEAPKEEVVFEWSRTGMI